jgi:hypothetical protein
VNTKLEFYDSISYTVRDIEPVRVRVNVGDVVDVQEETEGLAYARIAAIIRHQVNEGRHFAFFFWEWFSTSTHSRQSVDFPVYELQQEGTELHQLYALDHVDHTPRVHFVHVCTSRCTLERHDVTRHYFHNEFFYHAV